MMPLFHYLLPWISPKERKFQITLFVLAHHHDSISAVMMKELQFFLKSEELIILSAKDRMIIMEFFTSAIAIDIHLANIKNGKNHF